MFENLSNTIELCFLENNDLNEQTLCFTRFARFILHA